MDRLRDQKSWNDGKGLLGIYINKLTDVKGNTSNKGANPFATFTVDGKPLTGFRELLYACRQDQRCCAKRHR